MKVEAEAAPKGHLRTLKHL